MLDIGIELYSAAYLPSADEESAQFFQKYGELRFSLWFLSIKRNFYVFWRVGRTSIYTTTQEVQFSYLVDVGLRK